MLRHRFRRKFDNIIRPAATDAWPLPSDRLRSPAGRATIANELVAAWPKASLRMLVDDRVKT